MTIRWICARVLDEHVLTVGFARRFATYKRPNFLLRDPERLDSPAYAIRSVRCN